MATTSKPAAAEAFDPRVDLYINKAAKFAQPILEHFRETLHKSVPAVQEDMKWSRPFFVLNGQNLGYMGAFSKHCAFGFWSPKMTERLKADGIDGSESSGSFGRIASLSDLPSAKVLAGYFKEAAKLIANDEAGSAMSGRAGKSVKAPLPMPEEFAAALAKSKVAKTNFEALPPSCRREYIEWISTAKRAETLEKRLTLAVEMIAENRRMNDKYRAN
jgi:uncharacterized protein YdeI (YjbR/CyaY-like superfamily)